MIRTLPFFALAMSLCGCLWNLSGPSTTAGLVEEEDHIQDIDWSMITSEYRVRRVLSGDTLLVDYKIADSWETVKVKLLGVDAPDRKPGVYTEFQGRTAYAMVIVALDESTENPELLNLYDRDKLKERMFDLMENKRPSDLDLRNVRLLDDGWETRIQMWPYIPLRCDRYRDPETGTWKVKSVSAYVFVGKLPLNSFLIEEGFAKLDRTAEFEQRDYFERLEARAKRRKVGIWSLNN